MIRHSSDGEHRSPPDQDAIAQERFLRDLAASMFLLIGAKPAEIQFMYEVAPDGSRVQGLERLIGTLALEVIGGEGT